MVYRLSSRCCWSPCSLSVKELPLPPKPRLRRTLLYFPERLVVAPLSLKHVARRERHQLLSSARLVERLLPGKCWSEALPNTVPIPVPAQSAPLLITATLAAQ